MAFGMTGAEIQFSTSQNWIGLNAKSYGWTILPARSINQSQKFQASDKKMSKVPDRLLKSIVAPVAQVDRAQDS